MSDVSICKSRRNGRSLARLVSRRGRTLLAEINDDSTDWFDLSGKEFATAQGLSELGMVELRFEERSWWARITPLGRETAANVRGELPLAATENPRKETSK